MPARPPACRPTPCPTGSTSRPILFFLTRRIEYFRTAAPSLANTRKSKTFDNKVHPCDASPHGRPKTRFSPLYDTFRGYFSAEKWPWIEISMGWIGDSMGWKSKSMGSIDCAAAWKHENNAKRRTKVAVRINALPYSAQRFPAERYPPRRDAIHRVSTWRITYIAAKSCPLAATNRDAARTRQEKASSFLPRLSPFANFGFAQDRMRLGQSKKKQALSCLASRLSLTLLRKEALPRL